MKAANQKVLAGDIIKNLLQNLPKEEKNSPKRNDESKNLFNDSQNKLFFLNQTSLNKLKDLKNYIKGSKIKELLPNDSINNIILYPSLLNKKLLIEKLFSIFGVKSINEIYLNLIEAFNSVYSKDKNIELFQNSNDYILKKNQLFEIIQELNFFISPSIIYVSDPLINELSFNIFISYIFNDNKISKNILDSFINIFNIRHLVLDYFIWNKEKIIKSNNHLSKILSLISLLNIEKNFSYELIFFHKKNIFFEQDNFVYDLYCTYNKSIKQIEDLTDYLISIKRNWVSITVIEKIIYDKYISEKIDCHIKKKIIINLLDNNFKSSSSSEKDIISLSAIKDKKTNLKLISYFHIISDIRNFINFDFNSEIKELNFQPFDLQLFCQLHSPQNL